MRIIIVGGTGLIGSEIKKELSARHEIITAAHETGDVRVDITSSNSIHNKF